MEGRWCSAAEVAAAVSRAGGGAAPRDLAHACLPWGARPAPLILTEPEAEGEMPPPERGAPPPDLRGITRMLRMVQNEDFDKDPPVPDDGPLVISRPGCPPGACTHLVTDHANKRDVTTSALNPNVAEFVPRSAAPARAPSEGAGGSSAREREELAARLRDDISGGRDRCIAIARLMRLYAEPAPAPRLLTPDYFERPAAPEPAPQRPIDDERGGIPSEPESVEAQCGQREATADVRASVDKVRRWLDKEESPRAAPAPARTSPNLLLSPVTFRPRTPAPLARTPPPPPQPAAAPATRAYSPPARATAALHREYAARAAQAAAALPSPAAPDTLWTRLQTQLRQKEAEQRARASAAATEPVEQ